jgi:Ohr subfamily peroxiredoxin
MNRHQKRKTNYASLTYTGSGQRTLYWRRRGRPPARHRRCGSIASPLTVEPLGQIFYPTTRLNIQITIMKTLFTAEAISKGGRSGTIKSPDGLLDVTLGNPLEKGIEKRGPNPELLFAGAYSACYHGALVNAAKKLGTPVKDSTVRALVSLIEDDQGGYRLAVELYAQLPGIERIQAQRIMDEAHKTCPYSKALRGDTSIKLVVD